MSKLQWYWHRLRAMESGEVAAHIRARFRQWQDARRLPDWSGLKLESGADSFPKLPNPGDAPVVLREALARDVKEILAGHWKAFGHLELQVDDPPRWHKDYLVGKDIATQEVAFKLNHRELPSGADIKLIWELSRWHQLVRLAMATYVLDDERAGAKCVEWLEDWVRCNPPYRGWNWTSALEVGMRLVQFTWIDALLRPQAQARGCPGKMEGLRREILPAHARFAWRYRSFGSSANNHLIGELAGLILAVARWPELARCAAPLDTLQALWEREVLTQFAEDGGNREQALNYHLFSWEFCWQARAALLSASRKIWPEVEKRLNHAAFFFADVQVESDEWDYGDSDNACVLPLCASQANAVGEWRKWMSNFVNSLSLGYWMTERPVAQPDPTKLRIVNEWQFSYYPITGIATHRSPLWIVRWDLSPLGYPSTAAHGHLDALHLTVWFKGVSFAVDPGTGAYYADEKLRCWLASRAAHNAPCPVGNESPRRVGPFLWSEQHAIPGLAYEEALAPVAWLDVTGSRMRRRVNYSGDGLSWSVEDMCEFKEGKPGDFLVRWQFAPGSWIKVATERNFVVKRNSVALEVLASEHWADVKLVETPADRERLEPENPLAGIVSPAFRKTVFAPYLLLVARPQSGQPCVFRTTFLASPDS